MPYYLSSYIGRGTQADPCRPLGADEPGWAAIDLRADGGATALGNGLNKCLLYLPTAHSLAGVDLLADTATEPAAGTTLTRLRNVLGLPELADDTFDALVLALLLQPPALGWKPLVASRRLDRFEIHLGPLTRTQRVVRGGATASDTFNRADASPIDGNWTGVSGTSNLTSQALLVAAGGALSHVIWNPATFGADQFSQATVPSTLSSGGLCCRSTGSAPETFYAATNVLGDEHLIKYVSGTSTLIQSVTYTSGVGDVVRLEVEGSTLRYLANGAVVTNGTATDTAIPTGDYVGLYSVLGQSFDTWSGGDLASPPMAAAPTFVAAGSLATNATTASMAVTAPTLAANDIMIACLINKALGNVISPPDGTWTEVVQDDCDCTTAADDHRFAVYWKRAAAGDSGAAFTFTKVTDDNLLFAGVISAWRGCVTTGSPIDGGAVRKTTAAADSVTFQAFAPTGPNEAAVFIAFYGNDLTTFAAAMNVDTVPDCTKNFDLETNAGTDCTIACTSGPLTGAPFVAARTWASASTTDAGSTGVVLGLIPPALPVGDVVTVVLGDADAAITVVGGETPVAAAETAAVTLTEALTLAVTAAVADTAQVTLEEAAATNSIAALHTFVIALLESATISEVATATPVAAADTVVLSASESAAVVVLATLAAADTVGITLAEALGSLAVRLTVGEADSITLLDGDGDIVLRIYRLDETVGVVLTETAVTFAAVGVTDTLMVTLAEAPALLQVVATLADALELTLTEAVALAVQVAAADLAEVTLAEVAALAVALAALDTVTVDLVESGVPTVAFTVGEDVVVTLSESAGQTTVNINVVGATDTLVTTLDDAAATVQALLEAADATVLTLAEVLAVAATLQAADLAEVSLLEATQLFAALVALDAGDVTLTEAAEVGVTFTVGESLTVTLTETLEVVTALATDDTLTVALAEVGPTIQVIATLADTLEVTLTEAVALAVAVQAADLAEVTLAEVAALAVALATLDTVAITVSEDAAPILTFQVGETLVVTLTETAGTAVVNLVAVAAGDTLAVALTEAVPTVQALLAVVDATTLTLAEAVALAVQVTALDAVTLDLAEVATLAVAFATLDAVTVTVIEAATPTIAFQVGESVAVLLTEAASIAASGTLPIAGADLTALVLTEAASIVRALALTDLLTATLTEAAALAATLAVTDVVPVELAEPTPRLQVSLVLADPASLTLDEQAGLLATLRTTDVLPLTATDATAASLLALIQQSDLLTALLTEGTAVVALQQASDTLSAGLAEALGVRAALILGDTLAPGLAEALGPLLVALGVQETVGLDLTDAASAVRALATLDTVSVVIGESGVIVLAGLLGEVLVATVTNLTAVHTVALTPGWLPTTVSSLLPVYTAELL